MHTAPALYLAVLSLARVILASAHGIPCDAMEPARALLRAAVRAHGVASPVEVLSLLCSACSALRASTLAHLGALAGEHTDSGFDAHAAALSVALAADALTTASAPKGTRTRALALLRADAALRAALGCSAPTPAVVAEINRALTTAPVEAPRATECGDCDGTGEGTHGGRCSGCHGAGTRADPEALAA